MKEITRLIGRVDGNPMLVCLQEEEYREKTRSSQKGSFYRTLTHCGSIRTSMHAFGSKHVRINYYLRSNKVAWFFFFLTPAVGSYGLLSMQVP